MIRSTLKPYRQLIIRTLKATKGQPSAKIYDAIIKICDEFLPCSKCGEIKPHDEFFVQKTSLTRGGRGSVCKSCFKAAYGGGKKS